MVRVGGDLHDFLGLVAVGGLKKVSLLCTHWQTVGPQIQMVSLVYELVYLKKIFPIHLIDTEDRMNLLAYSD